MEGKYWKRRFESVTGEYKSWRKFSKDLIAQARRNSTATKVSLNMFFPLSALWFVVLENNIAVNMMVNCWMDHIARYGLLLHI